MKCLTKMGFTSTLTLSMICSDPSVFVRPQWKCPCTSSNSGPGNPPPFIWSWKMKWYKEQALVCALIWEKNYRVSVSSGYFKFDGVSSVFHPHLFSLHVILDEVKGPEFLSLLRVGFAQNYGRLVHWLRTGTGSIPWTDCWRYKEKFTQLS